MTEIKNEIFHQAISYPTEGLLRLDKLVEAASPQAVFGEPIQQGDITVITASAINVGLGYGLGGFVLKRDEMEKLERQEVNGGGGGGGGTRARPIAVISISSEGVKVDPIFDITTICLAFFSAFSAIFIASRKFIKMLK
jgi:uncharacterized spore protein YtfJ